MSTGPRPDGECSLAVEGPYDFDESLRFVPFGRIFDLDPAAGRIRLGRAPEGRPRVRVPRDLGAGTDQRRGS